MNRCNIKFSEYVERFIEVICIYLRVLTLKTVPYFKLLRSKSNKIYFNLKIIITLIIISLLGIRIDIVQYFKK